MLEVGNPWVGNGVGVGVARGPGTVGRAVGVGRRKGRGVPFHPEVGPTVASRACTVGVAVAVDDGLGVGEGLGVTIGVGSGVSPSGRRYILPEVSWISAP